MNLPNTDLLPPLFDQILTYYGEGKAGMYTRADIIKALENGIINAAAEHEREAAKRPDYKKSDTTIQLTTSDRLSGDHLSRAALNEQLQMTLSLSNLVIEIAVLLVEAQIDLRLQAARSFKLSRIEFVYENESSQNIAKWCQDVLQLTLQGAQRNLLWNRIGKNPPEGVRVLVESLQLSATLRDAIPYTIKVDRRFVDPLLVDSRSDRIRLLHISDLHLAEDLTDPQRGGSPTAGQLKHSFDAARLLGRAVDSLRPPFNLLVATGDLTTDGCRGSFETVLQYIQSGPISGENKMRIATFGLNAGRRQRILLPGNHDRYEGKLVPGQRKSYLFEEVLNTPQKYPYVRGFRLPGQADNDLTLLLCVFDSTLPHPDAPGLSRIDTLARGIIEADEMADFINLINQVERNGAVPDLSDAMIKLDKDNTIRVALLHHHPVVTLEAEEEGRRRKAEHWTRWFKNPLASLRDATKSAGEEGVKLEGAERFLRGCLQAGIQLVLFGHDHHPYRRAVMSEDGTKCLRAFCCPTTLEVSRQGNGFYLFDFMDKDTASLDFYFSRPNNENLQLPFSWVAEKSGRLKLSELSAEERESAHIVYGT